MHVRSILIVLLVIVIFGASPVAANLTKVTPEAPVFIGESNMDISSALKGGHNISWWKNGTSLDNPPDKTIVLYGIGGEVTPTFHYNFTPSLFSGATGTWYCTDKKPYYKVFEVNDPMIDIRVWDVDQDKDVTGQAIPATANVTYRIDTNLYKALSYSNRPNMNPTDSFFAVSLTDPNGRGISNVYTGSAGNSKTKILLLEKQPLIQTSPYYWEDGLEWNRNARGASGERLYPLGTYTFSISQDLNNIQRTFRNDGIADLNGKATKSASVTFLSMESVTTSTPAVTMTLPSQEVTVTQELPLTTASAEVLTPKATTAAPVAKKTTYASLPAGLCLLGIAGALVVMGWKR